MKKVLSFLIAICAVAAASAQIPVLKPAGVYNLTSEESYLYDKIDGGTFTEGDAKKLEGSPIFAHFYSNSLCSWYKSGSISRNYATSSLSSQGNNSYSAENIHDFNHRSAWVEGVKGYGVGESVVYEFAYNSPRIRTVYILNGYVKSESAWKANSRVKKLQVYYNDESIAILELQDSRSLQWFNIGDVEKTGKNPTYLQFVILEVYPGAKYQDTVISEIFFDK